MKVIRFQDFAEDSQLTEHLPAPIEEQPAPKQPEFPAAAETAESKPGEESRDSANAAIVILRACFYVLYMPLRTSCRYLYRHPFHAVLNMVLMAVIALLVFTGAEIHNQMILSKISDQTVDKIISVSRFTRSYNAEVIAANGEREFLRAGAPEWMQREGVRAVLFYSRKAGLPVEDQAALLAIADIESGFNPMARAATTTACGLFQFVKRTGEIFGLSRADCMDPWKNAKAAVDHYISNFEKRVQPEVAGLTGAERTFRAYELSYYLHHDGPESSNPSNDVKAIILSGSQFLFKTYHALSEEHESQRHAPSFAESFSNNLWKAIGVLGDLLGYDDAPFLSKFTASRRTADQLQQG